VAVKQTLKHTKHVLASSLLVLNNSAKSLCSLAASSLSYATIPPISTVNLINNGVLAKKTMRPSTVIYVSKHAPSYPGGVGADAFEPRMLGLGAVLRIFGSEGYRIF
jgi:hypothetical protein